jgi:hypothetical protein
MLVFTDSSRPALYRSPTSSSLVQQHQVQQHQVSNVASSGPCVAELYALYTIALRDLYGFLDVIAFTPEANAVGNNEFYFADLRSSVLRDANKL